MKRIQELKKLSSDHHRALVLAKRAKKVSGDPNDVWLEIEKYYSSELEIHLQLEESYIVPNLMKLGKYELVNRIVKEHAEIRGFFHSKPARTFDALISFGQLLEQHVRFEERELFNVVQNIFGQKDLDLIEKSCR